MTQMRTCPLHKVLAGLLVPMAAALLITHLGGLTHGLGLHGVLKALLLAPPASSAATNDRRGADFFVTVAGLGVVPEADDRYADTWLGQMRKRMTTRRGM
jgi:hypothetical protein